MVGSVTQITKLLMKKLHKWIPHTHHL